MQKNIPKSWHNIPAICRFASSYKEKPSGCWEWVKSKDGNGYAFIKINQKQWRGHRYSWTLLKGPIPMGMNVLHKCDNPSCVNPSHLFIGTMLDNMRDCAKKGRFYGQRQTHCKWGHEFSKENTYINIGTGARVCRECRRNLQRKYRKNPNGKENISTRI